MNVDTVLRAMAHAERVAMRFDIRRQPVEHNSAFMHDAVEDGSATLDNIEEWYGKETREVVDALTRREGEVYADYIVRVGQHPKARAVKLADLEDNLTDVMEFKPSLRSRYLKAHAYLTQLENAETKYRESDASGFFGV